MNPKGYRRGTRDLFARGYKKGGVEHLSTYLKTYHGKTGRVFNVSKMAVGVIVDKRVRGKILPKRISVRVEHVKHSQCRKDFLDRVHSNEIKKKEAKETGKPVICKRFAVQPKPAHVVSTKDNEPQQLGPIPYEFIA